jgi:octaprenyl-diphosphate synthase
MREGKLTLPAIYAVNKSTDAAYRELAMKVKSLESTEEEREKLMDFAIKNGGIEYAESVMKQYEQKAKDILDSFPKSDIRDSLFEYLDFVTNRNL